MKVYFSVDMEGVACIVNWYQVIPPSIGALGAFRGDPVAYERGRKLLTGEVKAAVEAAFEAGASEVLINEAHATMDNLLVEELDPRVRLISGTPKPLFMMEGLDSTFDAAIFLGYHAPLNTPDGLMGHNITGSIWVNGRVLGEAGMNAAVAGCLGVPVAMISGERHATDLAASILGPDLVCVPVKEGLGYNAANNLHPLQAQAEIRAGVKRALGGARKPAPFTIEPPIRVEVAFNQLVTAELAASVPGVERTTDTRVRFETDDYLVAYRLFRLFLNLSHVSPVAY